MIETLAQQFWQAPSRDRLDQIGAALADTPPETPQEVLKYFSAALHLDALDAAEQALTLMQAQFPNNPLGRIWPAELNLARGDLPAALAGFAALNAPLKQNPNVVRKWVTACIRAKDTDALEQTAPHVAALPDGIAKFLTAADAARFVGDTDTAAANYHQVLHINPAHIEAALRLAELAETEGALTKAVTVLEAALAHAPDTVALQSKLLWLQLRADPARITQDAITDFLAHAPNRRNALLLALGWARATGARAFEDTVLAQCASDWPEKAALEQATRALAENRPRDVLTLTQQAPTEPDLQMQHYMLRANALRSLRYRDGMMAMVDTLSAPPISADRLEMAAFIAMRADDLTRAGKLAKAGRTVAPDHLKCWNIEAQALTRTGQGHQVLETLTTVPEQLQTSPVILERRYWAARAIGDFDTAKQALAQAAENNGALRYLLVEFLLSLGDWPGLETLLDTWPAGANAQQAWLACAQGAAQLARFDFPGAQSFFDTALALNPDLAPAYHHRALTHLFLYNPSAALADLNSENRLNQARGEPARRPRAGVEGQLINEMLLEPDLARAACEATVAPNAPHRLLKLVAQSGDQTMLAISLLAIMRRKDRLDAPRATLPDHAAISGAIPAKVFQYRDSPTPDPDLWTALDGVRAGVPKAQYLCFTPETARDYVRAHAPAPVARAFGLSREPEERVNLLRLTALVHEGGIWVDGDSLCRGDLAPLLPDEADLVLVQDHAGHIGTTFLAATAGHPVLAKVADAAARDVLDGGQEAPWLRSGPGALSRAIASHIADAGQAQLPKGLHILPEADLLRRLAPNAPFAYKETARHWKKAGDP